MNHRFNNTGRMRITRDLFEIRMHEDDSGGASRFVAHLDGLKTLGLDQDARVIVEPYVKSSSMRFDYGPLGAMVPPASTIMMDIDRGAAVQFRIKIVDSKAMPGRLLALADQVRPRDELDDDNRRSILPIKLVNLGEAIWGIEVSVDEAPVLLLNNRVPDLASRLVDDPVLQGAIFPPAIRSILSVLLTEDALNSDQPWVQDWREFAHGLLGDPLPTETEADDVQELIEQTVEAFANRSRWATAAQPIQVVEPDYD